MRTLLVLFACLGLVAAAPGADAVPGRLIKVLPFFLDPLGRIATTPSLFDRDAYQARLRAQTNLISGMRFDVLWTAAKAPDAQIKIALELRGIGTNSVPRLETLATNVVPGSHRQWTYLPLAGADYEEFRLGGGVAGAALERHPDAGRTKILPLVNGP